MCIKYDVVIGIISKWKKYIILILLGFWTGLDVLMSIETGKMSLGNCVFYLFQGIPNILNQINDMNSVKLPVNWLFLNMYIAFIIGSYPTEDLSGHGKNILINSHSRAKWLIGKYIWGIMVVIVSYMMLYLGMIVFGLIFHIDMEFKLTKLFKESINCSNIVNLTESQMFRYGVIMPILSSITLVLMQISLIILAGPLYAFLIVFLYILSSVFFNYSVFTGNAGMILRNNSVYANSDTSVLLLINILIISVLFCTIGLIGFRKKDII